MKLLKSKLWMPILLLFFLAACSGGSGSDSINAGSSTGTETGTAANATTGTLSLGLIDKSTEEYEAVYVTIDEVRVHRCDTEGEEECEGTWITVATPGKTYDLLKLINGVIAPLGVAELEPGIYTQMRLYLGADPDDGLNILDEPHPHLVPNYVIVEGSNAIHELKIPSGYQSGIKLVREFEIVAGATVDLLLDFDADKSVVKAGKSGNYLLKPTIKIIDTLENATLSGTVTDDQPVGLGGVQVSAQTYDEGSTEDPKDQKDWVYTYTTTFTAEGDEDIGQYMMYLAPGDYNIVVYEPGFIPQCKPVTVVYGDVLGEDFELTLVTESGTVSVVVKFDPEQIGLTANISIRQICANNQAFEVQYLTGSTSYEIDLPAGDYEIGVSAEGRTTAAVPISLGADEQVDVELTLGQPATP